MTTFAAVLRRAAYRALLACALLALYGWFAAPLATGRDIWWTP